MRALLMALLAVLTIMGPAAEARQTSSLNAGWVFKREDIPAASGAGFDDKAWLKVTLPHTFNAGDGADGGTYYRGAGWYRKTLDLKPLTARDRLYLQFDGAALVTEVFVNGTRIGRHDGGYSTFRFDITPAVKAGQNLIAVRVDNAAWPHIAPLGGDFTIFGGLYRGVSLIQTSDAGFDMLDHGSPGVAVTATLNARREAQLNIVTSLRNSRKGNANLIVRTRVFSEGREVLSLSKGARLRAGQTVQLNQAGIIVRPRLWNGRVDPHLYNVVTEVSEDRGLLDRVVTPFGVRTVEFDATRGLLLNGQPYPVHGVNLHASRSGVGAAMSNTDISEDFDMLDELGVTGVRLVHYPHAQRAYEEADRRGILILTEVPVNATVADTQAFRANAAQQVRELIRQNINHPSIIAWGLGNEVYATEPHVANILMELNNIAIEEDDSRPTIYAHCCQADNDPKAMQSQLIGFNRYFGWYADDFAKMGTWADGFHKAFPEKPFAVTEYGAGGSAGHQQDPAGRTDPTSGWHPEQYQTLYHEANWAELSRRPFIWGKFVWQGFDAASDSRNEGEQAGINDKGLITYDRRVKKDAFYFYKAQWSQAPLVYITSRRYVDRKAASTDVKVYSNQPSVTLKLNGAVIGTQKPVGGIVIFKSVILKEGINEVTAESPKTSDKVVWRLSAPVPSLVRADRP
ncbi:glycoside hydrolase family 2 protein [Asticcacaulis machinosus]|uniref:Glycoside hydrolase family 2 TIM barrel-domain containing protein n=1 Tax=Asticcacaulis machinosus TaxID=2984211 RepID=A0ABT5HJH3_9CAUL|nr:glycoside hydrolase family 2 TIM barrel-domain containing protein [Asticcacaulis machinosus]MDC7676347.1 glycoside hydrolase family 2 TIM barrel-domain containing protein [Asticcacaulis machinosus]